MYRIDYNKATRLWNPPPQDLVNIRSPTSFKKALKTFLFMEHYGEALLQCFSLTSALQIRDFIILYYYMYVREIEGSMTRVVRSAPQCPARFFVEWDFSQGFEGFYVRSWSLNLLFCRRGFGLVVSVVVPLMLAVLPCERSRVQLPV
jgi:hypothetical protein